MTYTIKQLEDEVIRLVNLGLEMRAVLGRCAHDGDGRARMILSIVQLTPPDSIAREVYNRPLFAAKEGMA